MKITKLPDITDNINTLKDIYKHLGLKESEILIFKKPKNSLERYINACAIIPLIVKVYNQGWIPDWTNNNEYKYLPYSQRVGSGWSFCGSGSWYATGPSGHHYKNRDLLKIACTKFSNVYNDFYNG